MISHHLTREGVSICNSRRRVAKMNRIDERRIIAREDSAALSHSKVTPICPLVADTTIVVAYIERADPFGDLSLSIPPYVK